MLIHLIEILAQYIHSFFHGFMVLWSLGCLIFMDILLFPVDVWMRSEPDDMLDILGISILMHLFALVFVWLHTVNGK